MICIMLYMVFCCLPLRPVYGWVKACVWSMYASSRNRFLDYVLYYISQCRTEQHNKGMSTMCTHVLLINIVARCGVVYCVRRKHTIRCNIYVHIPLSMVFRVFFDIFFFLMFHHRYRYISQCHIRQPILNILNSCIVSMCVRLCVSDSYL